MGTLKVVYLLGLLCTSLTYGLQNERGDNAIEGDNSKHDEIEENDQDQINPCLLSPDPGPCNGQAVRYFYDSKTKRCRQFIYGGCQGNTNRFLTENDCLEQCLNDNTIQALDNIMKKAGSSTSSPSSVDTSGMLTLAYGSGMTSFTFSSEYPYIQLKAVDIKTFQLRQTREITLEFRSPEAQGLLLYHTLRNPPPDEPKYELYVILEGGELKTIHVYGANETTLLVGKGLNRDRWHSVSIRVDPSQAILQVQVDGIMESINLEGLDKDPAYSQRENIASTIFIGGMNWVQDEVESSYLFEHFVGCLKNIRLKSGPNLESLKPLQASAHRGIVEGCIDKCKAGENKCRNGGLCINHYDYTTCDCFGTRFEGDSCDYDNPTTMTLRGYSYISYRIYDWRDRAHSERNKISMLFRALMGDSILFYAGGAFPYTNHVAVTLLSNNSLYVEVDFGDGPHGVALGEGLANGQWHNFTLIHNGPILDFLLNGAGPRLVVEGDRHYLRFDPHIYIGGDRKPLGAGLRSSNNFVGCLSEVYYNDVSILHRLRVNSPQALYHSIFRPEIGHCENVPVVPVTFPFRESKMVVDFPPSSTSTVKIRFDFKTRNATAVLAHGTGYTINGTIALWELRLYRGEIEFRVSGDAANETQFVLIMNEGQRLADGSWHQVHLYYSPESVGLAIDYRRPKVVSSSKILITPISLNPQVVIGVGFFDSQPGMVGCIRDLIINNKKIDTRSLIYTEKAREVSLDNCQLVDPCRRPNACEHGGQCMVDEGRVVCDCTGTGYTGKNCHFALYKRTCEELALLGYMKSGVYEIDIDGNGPHPPAHVRCEFESNSGERKTVVEHNLPRDVEIRSRNIEDVVFNLTYREFNSEMLQSLISQSLQCRQYIRYDCYKAPLELRSYTWFSSAGGNLLDYLGNAQPGRCPCSVNKSCLQPNVFCNCDADEPRWLSDEGYLTRPEELGVTQIFALRQKRLEKQGEGRITLGPLECVEANTQQYVVTFKSPDSYMEVPGWHRGDLAFSFRTSSERAILLYQPLLHPKHPYFRVLLVNDHELTLEFSINGEPRSVTVKSSRDLNSGEWQQVWIDYNEYHVRFTVNQESILMDLNDGEEFGPFEATLFVGGAPEEILDSGTVIHKEGLIGCFRGLVMNNEVVNLYAYMNARFPDMIQKHCRPSCDPNPCLNGATCVEYWGSYKCLCENPLAHFGYNCETDINQNALTFRIPAAFVEANATALAIASNLGLSGFFKEDILVNIRTFDTRSLIFYAYDFLNNFVQLHIDDGNRVIFTFNSGNTIVDVSVVLEGLTTGKSIQILVDREPDSTTLHVNNVSHTVTTPLRLVEKYARDPWVNKEKELVKPPRPVRRPEEFYQVFLGGVDVDYMDTQINGFTGCLRGLRVGTKLLDLTSQGADGFAPENEEAGVIHNCVMKCDQQPCKNGGTCLENFRSNNYSCDCEFTSYYGETCNEEKGAYFGGDSYITAQHTAVDLDSVKVQLAFSTTAVRNIAQALLLIQTTNNKTKYILVSLTALGYLRIEDDRGMGVVYGAEIKTINFLNGARHSVYYRRDAEGSFLLVDRDEIALRPLSASIHSDGLVDVTDENALHIGGVKSSNDPRFADYDQFDGCISNVVVEVDDIQLHPLRAYLGYEGDDSRAVTSLDRKGIEEEARCAAFSINPPGVIENDFDSDNETSDQDWIPKPPLVLPYKPIFSGPPHYDPTTSNRILVGIGCIFLAGAIFLTIYMCKAQKRSKERKYLAEEDEHPLITPTLKPSLRPALRNPVRNVGVTTPVVPKANPTNNDSTQRGDMCSVQSPVSMSSATQMVADLFNSINVPNLDGNRQKPSETEEIQPPLNSFLDNNTSDVIAEQGSNVSSTTTDENGADTSSVGTSSIHGSSSDPTSQLVEETGKLNASEPATTEPVYLNGRAPLGRISEVYLSDEDGDPINSLDLIGSPMNEVTKSGQLESQNPAGPGVKVKRRHGRSLSSDGILVPSPVYVADNVRTFANPLSYLGGPRLHKLNLQQSSKESVISIDD